MLHRIASNEHEPAPIPSFGTGWKIFRTGFVYQQTYPLTEEVAKEYSKYPSPSSAITQQQVQYGVGSMLSGPYTVNPLEHWVCWRESGDSSEMGFCFFMTRIQAIEALRQWNRATPINRSGDAHSLVVKRIRYRLGVGEVNEYQFISGIVTRMALCKMFKVIN